MASAAPKNHCNECQNGVTTCTGCAKRFCVEHFIEHRQVLDERMDEVAGKYNHLRQTLELEETRHPFFSRIERWRENAMKKIEDAARQAKLDLQTHIARTLDPLKQSLKQIDDQLKSSHPSKNYTEEHLNTWMKRLEELRNMVEKRPNVDLVERDTPSFIGQVIVVDKSVDQKHPATDIALVQLATPRLMTNSSELPSCFPTYECFTSIYNRYIHRVFQK